MLSTDKLQLVNEATLVKKCIEGDRNYQNYLYKHYSSRMMGICMRYAKSKEDAQDILQEGFIKVFTCIKQFKAEGTLEAWMKKIFVNCALQKLREMGNEPVCITIDYANEMHHPYFLTDDLSTKFLIKCIQKLPLITRLVFNLYVFEGFKHKEIAAMLTISEGTSKSNLFDARTNLKKQLEQSNYFSLKNAVANE